MVSLDSIEELKNAGRFAEALAVLDDRGGGRGDALAASVLRVELLEPLGRLGPAQALASSLLSGGKLSLPQKSACEQVLGTAALEGGDIDGAVAHFQRAAEFAREGKDIKRLCRSHNSLTVVVSDRSGPDAAAPLLGEMRSNVTSLGDPHETAALHLYVGEMEGRRGLLHSAQGHASVAARILRSFSNLWLESLAANLGLALALLRSDFTSALSQGLHALELASQAGSAGVSRSILGNLGNLFYWVGDFDRAVDYFERAVKALPSVGEKNNALLESLARIRLTQDQLPECAALLGRIDDSIRNEADRALYVHRNVELTRVQLYARENRIDDALGRLESVIALAARAGDRLLLRLATLTKAEVLQGAGRSTDPSAILESVDGLSDAPEMDARCEEVIARAALSHGDSAAARQHHARAQRLCQSIGNAPTLIEINRSWNQALRAQTAGADISESTSGSQVGRSVLQSIAVVVRHAGRCELVAREILDVLENTDSVYSAVASVHDRNGVSTILDRLGDQESECIEGPESRIIIEGAQNRTVDIVLRPKPDVESKATLRAVTSLLASLHELERARAERDERATLWPVEDLPADGDRSVIAGHMREQMTMARRVAKTNVNVLITGESGTGKDIIARAIHTFSDRADKPFVPFNCTAVPRDLLESHLFGHRRGAFTGADRDQPGLIRSAREGTLFLDEVGELGLDVQPKLLRFLESGEISPLGEPSPFTVNVRIVAATNSKLEEAVREGRFREDLFYRLNVVHLSIKPLRERRDEIPGLVHHFVARAAEEFKKGMLSVTEETMERLLIYRWPGNVRQLQNELRRMVALAEPGSTLGPNAISDAILGAMPMFRPAPVNGEIAVSLHDKLPPTLARIEGEMIKAALRTHHGKVDNVAKALGISRKGLYLKRQRLGL